MLLTGKDKMLRITFCLFLSMLFLSCGQKHEENNDKTEIIIIDNPSVLKDLTATAINLADSLLTTLTLEERVGQCLMPSILSDTLPSNLSLYLKYIKDYHIGGIVLMKGNSSAAKKLSEIGEKVRIPLFIAIDAEWGLGMRLEDAPKYPKNGLIDKDADDDFLFDYGREIAKESKELGINMVLGPVIDIAAGNRGVIGTRSYGPDPNMVAEYGIAYAKGLEAGGVVSVAKHFPGHGRALNDSHNKIAKLDRDISVLDSMDLKPFREYINSGLSGVMAGHIQAKALDPDGTAASVSMDMLTSLLREELGFKGLILTDAFNMGGAKGFSALQALKAGADIVLCPDDLKKEYENILRGIDEGSLDVSTLNERCLRILFYKALFLILPKEEK